MNGFHRTVALIVAAGNGERAGGAVPKQFAMLGGKALICHAIDNLSAHPDVAAVFVVIGAGQVEAFEAAAQGRAVASVVMGGTERQDSVFAGLCAIAASGGADRVLIHDAARPFISPDVIDRLLAALETAEGVIPVLPVVDTLARDDGTLGDVIDRSQVSRVQTPQAFHFDAIMTSHQKWQGLSATDDAQLLRQVGFRVLTVAGDSALEKITHPDDFAAAEARLAAHMISRTALGFDVHRLEKNEELWLGGILVPHDKGLSGHSDADVVLHALTDALLGTVAKGDIGSHFPPTDPQWRGARSARFVEHARDLILAVGGIIDHVDLTIICEAPKIGPYRDAMRAEIAGMLRLPLNAVSVKATTTERLGLTGRGEGIAAQAVATVRTPKES